MFFLSFLKQSLEAKNSTEQAAFKTNYLGNNSEMSFRNSLIGFSDHTEKNIQISERVFKSRIQVLDSKRNRTN
ncbi:MAG: hypothetical protein WCK02_00845 [Bacteroidota bacterium]